MYKAIILSFLLIFLIHCDQTPDQQNQEELDIEIPFYKTQHEICNEGSEFDLNDQCTNVSADQNAKCLETAKQACQSATACVQKALLGLLMPSSQTLDKQFKQVKTITDLKNLLNEGPDITEEYNKVVEKCKEDSSKNLKSLLKTTNPSKQQPKTPANTKTPTPKQPTNKNP